MLWRKRPPKDPSIVPVIDMKFLIILHILLLVFIGLVHWKIMSLSDF